MMNPLQMALKRIYATIPMKILEEAFKPRNTCTTLDDRIHEEIIVGRVLDDCNLSAGKPTRITLMDSWAEHTKVPPYVSIITTGEYTVYRIPPEYRENKPIVALVGLEWPPYAYSNSTLTSFPGAAKMGATACDLACATLNSVTGGGSIWHPTPVLKNGDLIYIDPPQASHINWVLTCRLAYDDQFTNLNDSAIKPLQDLIECATKAYIYNTLVLEIDSIHLVGGLEMDKFKEIVESYSDQNEKYSELLMEFRGGALLDVERIKNIIYWAL